MASASTSASISTSISALDFPPLTKADVLACAFSSWYPTFRRHSPKATVIGPLTSEFINYLESDGVFLPEGSGPMGISELSDSDDDESANGTDSSDDQSWQISFPELDAEIRAVVTKYEGAVFPKLNWSSPRDAAWMLPGQSLKCQTPADIYLLLKSSDFITHDLDYAFDACVDYESPPVSPQLEPEVELDTEADDLSEQTRRVALQATSDAEDQGDDGDEEEENRRKRKSRTRPYEFELVLKKWFEIPRSQEWRCFVREKHLVAISQRDPNFYDFLQPDSVRDELVGKILAFFEREIKSVFPSDSYVVDLYLTRSGDRLFILDFNPYAPSTDSLLFDWSEIHSLPLNAPSQFRIVRSESMTSGTMPAFSHNRYPKDVVELSDGASIAEFAKEWATKLEQGVKDTVKGGEGVEELVGR